MRNGELMGSRLACVALLIMLVTSTVAEEGGRSPSQADAAEHGADPAIVQAGSMAALKMAENELAMTADRLARLEQDARHSATPPDAQALADLERARGDLARAKADLEAARVAMQPKRRADDPLAITIRPVKRAFTAGDTLEFVATLKNRGPKPITLMRPAWPAFWTTVCKAADGAAYASYFLGQEEKQQAMRDWNALPNFELQPGDSQDVTVGFAGQIWRLHDEPESTVMNETVNLAALPGRYSIQMTHGIAAPGIGMIPHWSGVLTSEAVEFEIVNARPRPEAVAPAAVAKGLWRQPIAAVKAAQAIAFSPDARRVALVADQKVLVFDPKLGELVPLATGDDEPLSVAFSPDGRWLATGGHREMRVWDVPTGKMVRSLPSKVEGETYLDGPFCRFLSAGRLARYGSSCVGVWDFESFDTPERIFKFLFSHACVVAPDGERLLTTAGGSVRVWAAATGKKLDEMPLNGTEIRHLALSGDGMRLASSGHGFDMSPQVRDLATGKRLAKFALPGRAMISLLLSPDGRTLVTFANEEANGRTGGRQRPASLVARVWDVTAEKHRGRLPGSVTAVAFVPDGTLAVAGPDGVRFWDVEAGCDHSNPAQKLIASDPPQAEGRGFAPVE
jgi:hypothetical protein